MAEAGPSDDQTEAATPRRLQRARDDGQVAVSRELAVFGSMAGAVLALHFAGGAVADGLGRALEGIVANVGTEIPATGEITFIHLGLMFLRAVAPFVLGALLGGAFLTLLQTGFLFRPAALRPDFSRVSPGHGIGRLFSAESGGEAIRSIVKIGAIAMAVWMATADQLDQLRAALLGGGGRWFGLIGTLAGHILIASLMVQAAIAGADMLWVRLRHARGLRMSRQEIRDESREAEGDPKIKARIRQIRMQRARRRMLAAVPKATVVITNPTHYAVALAYDRGSTAAPRVVAKGIDSMAARIRETAMAHNVPLVANPPLARALYVIKLDTDIPSEHYKAVAEIIAYVWRLGRRASAPP